MTLVPPPKGARNGRDDTDTDGDELPELRPGDRVEFERAAAVGLPYSVTVVRVLPTGTHPEAGAHGRDSVVVATPAGRQRTIGVHRLGLGDDAVRLVTTEEQDHEADHAHDHDLGGRP